VWIRLAERQRKIVVLNRLDPLPSKPALLRETQRREHFVYSARVDHSHVMGNVYIVVFQQVPDKRECNHTLTTKWWEMLVTIQPPTSCDIKGNGFTDRPQEHLPKLARSLGASPSATSFGGSSAQMVPSVFILSGVDCDKTQ
jgi:hypothetical protein